MSDKIILSIVIPVYSGESFLIKLFSRIQDQRNLWLKDKAPIEIGELIFVDDNSIDNSGVIIHDLCRNHIWVSCLKMSKNFGQHPATIAGILHTSGNWVVTLDEDLQHAPEDIEIMLYEAIKKDLDIVYASPQKGPHGKILRDLSSVYFKKLMVLLTGDEAIPLYNSFRLIRGDIARSAASVCSHDTYLDVSFSWFTIAIGGYSLKVHDLRNENGQKSGYSFMKLFSHARKLLFSSQVRIYRVVALFGILLFSFGLIYSGFIFVNEFFNPGKYGSRGWPSLIITTMIFGSSSIILLSILLEYISHITLKIQGKPVFFVINRSISNELKKYFELKYENS